MNFHLANTDAGWAVTPKSDGLPPPRTDVSNTTTRGRHNTAEAPPSPRWLVLHQSLEARERLALKAPNRIKGATWGCAAPLGETHPGVISICLARLLHSPSSNPSLFSLPLICRQALGGEASTHTRTDGQTGSCCLLYGSARLRRVFVDIGLPVSRLLESSLLTGAHWLIVRVIGSALRRISALQGLGLLRLG